MIQSNAKTRSDFELSENGMKLRLAIPAAPYRMPHKDGGFIMLVGYDDVGGCSTCETAPEPSCGCTPAASSKPATATCGPNCCNVPKDNCAKPSCGKPEPTPTTAIKRYEIVEYSGFEDDGVTAILTSRGVDGTMVQSWCAGTIAVQTFTGADYNKLLTTLEEIKKAHADDMEAIEKAHADDIEAIEKAHADDMEAIEEKIICLMPVILEGDEIVSDTHSNDTNGENIGGDDDWNVIKTISYSKEDLAAMGMEDCHNTVSLRFDVNGQLSQDNKDVARITSGIIVNEFSFKSSDSSGDNTAGPVIKDIPVNDNGGIDINLTMQVKNGTGLGGSRSAFRWDILGFSVSRGKKEVAEGDS